MTKLDDFLNDLSEELAPSLEFIAHANRLMDNMFRKLQACLGFLTYCTLCRTLETYNFFHGVFGKNLAKQESIPVGCVPSAAGGRVYLPGCTYRGRAYLPRGYTCQGVVPARGCTCIGGVPARGRVYLPGGGCTCWGCTYWGVPAGACTEADTPTLTDGCKNITLPQLRCGR